RYSGEFLNDHLSNWYVRLNRNVNVYNSPPPASREGLEVSEDKRAAYETLYECLLLTAQLMAPIATFFSEWLYRNLTDNIFASGAKESNTLLQYESTTIHYL
ncbi:MAG: class I tRNA ligase family protein, partial [Flammeovirgaceae bacterium]|nr:class I tRNA ligase family protein [Flammeovirgaceae bacterium]